MSTAYQVNPSTDELIKSGILEQKKFSEKRSITKEDGKQSIEEATMIKYKDCRKFNKIFASCQF